VSAPNVNPLRKFRRFFALAARSARPWRNRILSDSVAQRGGHQPTLLAPDELTSEPLSHSSPVTYHFPIGGAWLLLTRKNRGCSKANDG
jgi:hypothetical protein